MIPKVLLPLLIPLLLLSQEAVFEAELWGHEGLPFFATVAAVVPIYAQPNFESEITDSLPYPVGTPIEIDWAWWLTSLGMPDNDRTVRATKSRPLKFTGFLTRTTKPGSIEILKEMTLGVGSYGSDTYLSRKDLHWSVRLKRSELSLEPGTILEYLQYRAEGSRFVLINDQVIGMTLDDARQFRVIEQPELVLWLKIAEMGNPIGWVPVATGLVERTGVGF